MIVFDNLTKTYGSVQAVSNLSFEVRPGTVCGFLGPNGGGKSTSMRCLVGLTHPTSGSALIKGKRYQDLANPAAEVGVMLDASAQHPGRTGRSILSTTATVLGLPDSSIDEALNKVGLTAKEAKRRVGTYSLGMRQRLGLANALMGSPSVLVLDEPANGLDPAGIRWMRTLLRDFADRGGAVLLSSHLLHEVQQIADYLVMIGHGRIVAQGSQAELLETTDDLEELFLTLTADTSREANRS